MRLLFTFIFSGNRNSYVTRNIKHLNTLSFLLAAAKCIRHFSLDMPGKRLTGEQQPLLNVLERHIWSIGVSHDINLSKRKTQTTLYVLHRLLDHGVAKKIVLNTESPAVLAWLLHGRGSQYVSPELKDRMHSKKRSCISQAASASSDGVSCSPGLGTRASQDHKDQVTPCKRTKLDSVSLQEEESEKANFTVDPQVLCQILSPCDESSAVACPWGQIECLEIRQCGSNILRVLIAALPTFFCLRSLSLHSFFLRVATFRDSDVLGLARALQQLTESSRSSLTDLSIGILPYNNLVEILLDSSPNLTSLYVEIETFMWGPTYFIHHPRPAESDVSELPLEKLALKVTEVQRDLCYVTSVLRRSPYLTSFHAVGIRLPIGSSQSQLLSTLSESNRFLRSLNLEDMNLSDCLPNILELLRDCKLEELWLKDCRLLERLSSKEESLQKLVAALKMVPSLQLLSLAQNRLARNVFVLAELFSGSSPSSLKHLDISSNFIHPAELLEFAERLRTHHPADRLTLDLRRNLGDRDPDTWNTALKMLQPFCVLLVNGWNSTNTMADYISNM
ncbi:uncharacterized protein LOC121956837 [Plectropomus leopardus]|uniref:uncharacterized protein LOC121956837 n=1 Tax=Plectropomus leopardus TaxID=160734 RepID=UPI001C4DA5F7|nr:uncharacterized protein LOC121956837 [Plectropomus leopardus]